MATVREIVELAGSVRVQDGVIARNKRMLRRQTIAQVVGRLRARHRAWQRRYGAPGISFIWWLIEQGELSRTWERDRGGVSEEQRMLYAERLLKKLTGNDFAILSEAEGDRTRWITEGLQDAINVYSDGKTEVRVLPIRSESLTVVDLHFAEYGVEGDDDDTAEDRIAEVAEDARDEVDGYRPEDDSDDD